MNVIIFLEDQHEVTVAIKDLPFFSFDKRGGEAPLAEALRNIRGAFGDELSPMSVVPIEVKDIYHRYWWIHPSHITAIMLEEPQHG